MSLLFVSLEKERGTAVANFMVIKFTAIKFRRIALARSNTRITCITQVRDKVNKNSTLADSL